MPPNILLSSPPTNLGIVIFFKIIGLARVREFIPYPWILCFPRVWIVLAMSRGINLNHVLASTIPSFFSKVADELLERIKPAINTVICCNQPAILIIMLPTCLFYLKVFMVAALDGRRYYLLINLEYQWPLFDAQLMHR